MPTKPHLVLLMADHMRFDCLGCYGDLGVRTPNLDALARESVVFDRAYCSTPLCAPTRTSIHTGKWCHSTGVIVNGGSFEMEHPHRCLGPEHDIFYQPLEAGGYAITHIGIQHLNSTPSLTERVPKADINRGVDWRKHLKSHGFEEPSNSSERMPVPEFDNGEIVVKHYHRPEHVERTAFGAEHFLDVYYTDQMIDRIRRADPSSPQAFILPLWAPHPPYFVPEPYFSMYNPASIRLPENVGVWYDGQPGFLLCGTGARGTHLRPEEWRRTWAAYFGLVTMVDDCLGRVMAELKRRGFWDDALVVFTMDHGDCLGAHRLFQKFAMYEESAHVPLLVKPPRGGDGSRRRQPVGHVDLASTFCDYAGVTGVPGAQGQSLRPLIENPTAPWRDATFSEFNGDHGRGYPTRAIFTEHYKYIYHFCGRDELYDTIDDPRETRSLAADPRHADLKQDLRRRLIRWMRETGDMLDIERDREFTPARWKHYDRVRGWVESGQRG